MILLELIGEFVNELECSVFFLDVIPGVKGDVRCLGFGVCGFVLL